MITKLLPIAQYDGSKHLLPAQLNLSANNRTQKLIIDYIFIEKKRSSILNCIERRVP